MGYFMRTGRLKKKSPAAAFWMIYRTRMALGGRPAKMSYSSLVSNGRGTGLNKYFSGLSGMKLMNEQKTIRVKKLGNIVGKGQVIVHGYHQIMCSDQRRNQCCLGRSPDHCLVE